MFFHAYNNYMKHAFPADELKPISCMGRHREGRGTLDDVLGDFSLTLVDAADTLAVMQEWDAFEQAVWDITRHVSFDKDVEVSVFETTIRVLGGLLSTHLAAVEHKRPANYTTELLDMAIDLGDRLLTVFETPTGIPLNKVNLRYGAPRGALWPPSGSSSTEGIASANVDLWETCLACGGTLLMEFGMLSRLAGHDRWEEAARTTLDAIWARRSPLDLLGNVINSHSGAWAWSFAHIGAGSDSYYETLLKSYMLFDDPDLYTMFNTSYHATHRHAHNGWFVPVDMNSGSPRASWIDALGAFWPGLQALAGDIRAAKSLFERYEALWSRYGALPERFDIATDAPFAGMSYYPLRPELAESAYVLYQATKDPSYIRAGIAIKNSLERYTKVKCGYASISNVNNKSLEDRMDSYFLSEVCKYLYLLFDPQNSYSLQSHVFTTEGHPFPRNFASLRAASSSSSSSAETTKHEMTELNTAAQPVMNSEVKESVMARTRIPPPPQCARNRTIRFRRFPIRKDNYPPPPPPQRQSISFEPRRQQPGNVIGLHLRGVAANELAQVNVRFVPADAEVLLSTRDRHYNQGSSSAESGFTYGLLGQDVQFADSGSGRFQLVVADPLDACTAPESDGIIGADNRSRAKRTSGTLPVAVLAMRGNCTFLEKIEMARSVYHASAIIIVNHDANPVFQIYLRSSSDPDEVLVDDMLVVMTSKDEGQSLIQRARSASKPLELRVQLRNKGNYEVYGGSTMHFLMRPSSPHLLDQLRRRSVPSAPAFIFGDQLTVDTNALTSLPAFRTIVQTFQAAAQPGEQFQLVFNVALGNSQEQMSITLLGH
jgi:hypothetical protein